MNASRTASTADWRFEVLRDLADRNARRVLATSDLAAMARAVRPGVDDKTIRGAIDGFVEAGDLRRVGRGVFLNQRCAPPAMPQEVAPLMRAGAHLSLATSLGLVGALNNASPTETWAVVPASAAVRPRLGVFRPLGSPYVYRFHGLAPGFFAQTPAEERELLVNGSPVPMFKPEPALLHWLNLAGSDRSKNVESPPVDLDVDLLDRSLLESLAARWGLESKLVGWLAEVRAKDGGAPSLAKPASPTDAQRDAGAAAKARLQARRPSVR